MMFSAFSIQQPLVSVCVKRREEVDDMRIKTRKGQG